MGNCVVSQFLFLAVVGFVSRVEINIISFCFAYIVSTKRGSSLYGQPSWWSAPDDAAPLTLQPIHCATTWTEANPTPIKGKSLSPAPPDTNKKRSASVKAYGTLPREKKESKLTTRLIKKITPSSSKKASSSEGKASTSSSAASSASNSSSDLLKSSVARGTPKRETYIKKNALSNRPRSAEVISSSSSTTLQKPVSKFDRSSPQRHTYNKKEPTLSKKAHEEASSASKPEKKPRETIAELRQRMQQAKKTAAANKDAESDIQIFVPTKATPTEEATADHVTEDINSSDVVTSSGLSLNESDVQLNSQRKQWEINEVMHMQTSSPYFHSMNNWYIPYLVLTCRNPNVSKPKCIILILSDHYFAFKFYGKFNALVSPLVTYVRTALIMYMLIHRLFLWIT